MKLFQVRNERLSLEIDKLKSSQVSSYDKTDLYLECKPLNLHMNFPRVEANTRGMKSFPMNS